MRAKGYSTYRGRSPFKSFLKILAVIVVLLIALGVALIVYLQQFLVFSEDGVHLDLPPFFRQEETEPPQPDVPEPSPFLDVPPVEVVTPPPPPEPEGLQPVLLPQEALYDGTAVSQIEAAGGDGALFDMKADSGQLGYVSALELASGVSSADHSINVAIKALNQTERLYTIARVSCFKDHAGGNNRNLAITTNSGYLWTGADGTRWISPTSPEVQEYLTGICVELAQLGFDEILLDNAGYPNQGNLNWIKKGAAYDETQFAAVVGGFYSQLADALEEYGVKLSVVTTPEAMAGLDALTGQTPENLAYVSHLWVRDESGVLVRAEPSLGSGAAGVTSS